MAVTATHVTTDAKTRSLELAAAHGHTNCSHAARVVGWTYGKDGELVCASWWITSATSDAQYAVGYLAEADDAACGCLAAQHGHGCWHRGLGIILGRELMRLYSPARRRDAEREYRARLRQDANDAVIASWL